MYLDDILIFSRSIEQHLQHLRIVLEILRKHKFYCKMSKCIFGRSSIEFLGHRVVSNGIRVDPSKQSAIRDWPPPSKVKDVHSFLGLANYIRRNVAHFAQLHNP